MANGPPAEPDAIALSNGIRLTGRQWLGLGLFAVVILVFAPALWRRTEKFALEPDYRIPHDLSNDYWLYERFAGLAADHDDTLLIGDSVVWGEYVNRQETLSHYLNELAGAGALRQPRPGRRPPAGAWRADRVLRRERFGQERLAPVQPPVDELAPGRLAGRRGERVQPPPAGAAVRAERSRLQGGDFSAAGHPGGAAAALEQLDGPPAASLLRPDRHPRLDPGASLRQPADAAHAGAASLGQFAPAPAAALVQERHRQAGLSRGSNWIRRCNGRLFRAWSRSSSREETECSSWSAPSTSTCLPRRAWNGISRSRPRSRPGCRRRKFPTRSRRRCPASSMATPAIRSPRAMNSLPISSCKILSSGLKFPTWWVPHETDEQTWLRAE